MTLFLAQHILRRKGMERMIIPFDHISSQGSHFPRTKHEQQQSITWIGDL
jgi:hypothetical protein